MSNAELNSFIENLQYDPNQLLAVQTDGSTSSQPDKNRSTLPNAVIICTNINHTLRKNLDEVAILSPQAGAIFPGGIVTADQNLMEGKPTAVGLSRAPATLTLDLPGLKDPSASIVPTFSTVQKFMNDKLEEWSTMVDNSPDPAKTYQNAAKLILQVTKSYTATQASLDLGFKASWASGDLSTQLGVTSSSSTSVILAYFKQVFYTVTMDTPDTPASVFADSVTVPEAQRVFSDQHPPAYVRSVDYGRILVVKMETTAIDTTVKLEAAFDYATGQTKVGGKVDSSIQNIVNNSSFSVVALGGGASQPVQMFDGSSDDSLKGLQSYIADGACYERDNPGAPIAFTVVFLKDNAFATIGSSTDYTETQCVSYPNAFEKIVHSGAYVAKFSVAWTQNDQNGNPTVSNSWQSGNQTEGYTQTVNLPGDATDVLLNAQAETGLVWSPWGEIWNLTLDGPDNKTYTATGTTLNRTYSVSGP